MLPFELPPLKDGGESPVWNGKVFVLDGIETSVLEYSENHKGWNDELTLLHEEAIGESHPIDLASRRDAIVQVKKNIHRKNSVIMEIGCSSGFFLRDLPTAFPEAFIIGVDVVKDPLFRLAQQLGSVPLIRFDLLKCPLPDESIDVLVMLNVLEHIDDDCLALRNAYKLLKPGGALILELPASPFLYGPYDEELYHYRRYSMRDLKEKVRNAGFSISRASHLGFFIYPIFAIVKLLGKYIPTRNTAPIVKTQAKKTSTNFILRKFFEFESKYLINLKVPIGIRVLMTAKK